MSSEFRHNISFSSPLSLTQMAVNAGQNETQRMGNPRDRNGQSDQPQVSNGGVSEFWGSAVRPLEHGQQHGQRRRWPRPPCSASSAARASPSLARRHPVPPFPRAGVARDVTLGAQLNALTPAPGPVAPRPRPLLFCVRTLVTRHPRGSSARRVASAGAGRRRRPRRNGGAATDPRPQGCAFHCETAGGKAPKRVGSRATRVQIGTPFQLCPNSPARIRVVLTAIWGT
jgi:hypothetical protein